MLTGVPDAGKGRALMRDPSTALSYGALGAYAFWLYAFGPAVALLRTEVGFSYVVVGIYAVAWSAGSTATSASFAAVVARTGRRALLWGASLITVSGAALFVTAHDVAWTLAGAAVLGTAGTAMQLTVQSVLSDRHGARRGQALVEANIGAGACAVLAPLALGGLATTAAGWRSAMGLPALALLALFLAFRRYPKGRWPERGGTVGQEAGGAGAPRRALRPRLPASCWVLCFLVGVGIAVEFCIIYFASELLVARTALSPAAAATAMTAFYGGILLGRVAGAWIVRAPGRTAAALWGSVVLSVAGLAVVMSATAAVAGVLGIFVAGVGVANLFPLSVSLALGAAGPRSDAANGLAQVIGGVLVVLAPFLLGALADSVGLTAAFTIAPALAVVCGALLLASAVVDRRARQIRTDAPG